MGRALKCGFIPLLIGALLAAFLAIPIKTSAQTANPTRDLPEKVHRGETFDVVITFTAPENEFHAVGLADAVPAGWSIEADASECTPAANAVNVISEENRVEFLWYGPFDAGTAFTVVYHVTVPQDAEPGTYEFDGFLTYYVGENPDPFTEDIGGDSQIEVCIPILAVNPDPPDHDFGEVDIGESLSWSFEITNDGCGTLEWTVESDVDWISVDPASGTTTTETDTVTVMVDTSSLVCSCIVYEGHITIKAGDQEKTGTIKVHPVLPVTRDFVFPDDRPDNRVAEGSTFEVRVSFTAPADGFHAIGLSDMAPSGWTTQVDIMECSPRADVAHAVDNKVEIVWYGPYSAGTEFTAVYKVTVPEGIVPEGEKEKVFSFGPEEECKLVYYVGEKDEACTAPIRGEKEVKVVPGTRVFGTTGEVVCNILPGVTVTILDGEEVIAQAESDETGYYELYVSKTGTFKAVASKEGFRDEEQDLTIEGLGPDYEVNLDFRGETGLVPKAPSMMYVLACVHNWLYPPVECGLSMTKVLEVVHAWLYPLEN